MSDTFIRHLVAFIGMMIALLIFLAAYVSGGHGWWWTFPGVIIIYVIVYKLVNA